MCEPKKSSQNPKKREICVYEYVCEKSGVALFSTVLVHSNLFKLMTGEVATQTMGNGFIWLLGVGGIGFDARWLRQHNLVEDERSANDQCPKVMLPEHE